MIHWAWLILAFLLGTYTGIWMLCVLHAARHDDDD